MNNILIKADKINVFRQGKAILNNVSFEIGENDFITIVGPNGAGKSMLLKAIMGFYKIDSGLIDKKKNLQIGYMPQVLVADNTIPISVERFLRLNKKITRDELSDIATETNIEHLLNRQLFHLSGGERQRVLLARSLLSNPQLLILDEPAQNMDISGQLAFYRLIERVYKERKISIIMVSHDLHMVMASTRQVLCLYHHICCSGEPHMVAKDPEFLSLFGDDMAKMMAVYQHAHNHNHEH